MATTRGKSVYSPHPSFARETAILGKFKEKTGRTADEWVAVIRKSGPATEKDRRNWLKEAHGLTSNYAMYVAQRAEGKGGAENYDPEALVDGIFAGPKAGLRPIYKSILEAVLALGRDVKVCPCGTIVPFYRKHVFAQIRVPNRTRLDLGFALGDQKPAGKLIDTGGFAKKDRITHRIEIGTEADFSVEALRWLRVAYDRDA